MRTLHVPLLTSCLLIASPACGGESTTEEDAFGSDGGSTAPSPEDPGDSGESTSADAGEEGSTDGGAGEESETGGVDPETSGPDTKFDLPAPDTNLPPEEEPCEKVDLLFVIDNSGSMAGEQQNLVNSFPGFVEEIEDTLYHVESLHIGVTSTDANQYNPEECQKLGALVQGSQAHGDCTPYDSGQHWMTEDQVDLEAKFTCAAQLGTGGHGNERPMDSMQLALAQAYNAPGACNEAFVRDDALLVTVLITDEEDDGTVAGNSQGDPPDWFDGVVSAKQGVETNVVVLALVGQEMPNECGGIGWASGSESAEPALRILEFANMFTYGFTGDVCADSYQEFFHEAVSVIDTACTNFTPPP